MRNPILVLLSVPWAIVPLEAQSPREWQAQAVATFSDNQFLGGGLGFALRRGRLRIGVSVSAGDLEGSLAGRGEVSLSYHLHPAKRRGVTPYAGGGVAITGTRDETLEYLVLFLGAESNPAGNVGWFVEGGIGGGIRVAAGLRIHRPRR